MKASGGICLILAALLSFAPAASTTAQEVRREPVHFAAGKTGTSIKGAIRGYETVEYVLGAAAGQRMVVKLSTSNTGAYFNLLPPGSRTAIHNGSVRGNEFSGTLNESGDYIVQVYLMRSAARRGEKASYKLDVKIQGAQGTPPPPAIEAEYFIVTGVRDDDPLNLRAGPSTNAQILATFGPGVVVHNSGCRMSGSLRWCAVELARDLSVKGWVAAKFLTPTDAPTDAPTAAAPAKPAAEPPAPVAKPAPPAPAPGTVACSSGSDSLDLTCEVGAIPDADGAVISLRRPDTGARRVLIFDAGDQSFSSPDNADLAWLRQGEGWWISANGAEFYLLPDALIAGD